MNYTEDNLKKLTVAHLKAICKSENITGYSKIAKPLLVQKILDRLSAHPTAGGPKVKPVYITNQSSQSNTPHLSGKNQLPNVTAAATLSSSLTPIAVPNGPCTSSTQTGSPSPLMAVTNVTQSTSMVAHISTLVSENRASAGVKRPTMDSTATDSLSPSKKTRTSQNATVYVISPLRAAGASKRPITPNSDSPVKKLKIDDANTNANFLETLTTDSQSKSSLTATQVQRKKTLEEDPLASNVQHCSTTCKACGKVIKYTMFDLFLWNKHKSRCKDDLDQTTSTAVVGRDADSFLTVAQAQRKNTLEQDPLASNIQDCSVTCKACGKLVEYSSYGLHHWNEHKMYCQEGSSRSPASAFASFSNSEDVAINSFHEHLSSETALSSPSTGNGNSSFTAAQVERKKTLEDDPLASNVQSGSVTCKPCGKAVKFGNCLFDLSLWKRHKARCKSNASFISGSATKKTKRFTPLVIHKKVSMKASISSSATAPPIALSKSTTIAQVSASVCFPARTTVSSASTAKATQEDRILLPSASPARAPPTAKTLMTELQGPSIPPSHLRKMQKDAYDLIIRKPSSVPDITLEVNSNTSLSLYHLDFPTMRPLTLDRITFPPAISQRKQVARFAIILSFVRFQDLSACMLVSRMFRYATYLSASTRLTRNFAGYRFNRLMHRLPMNMINMWPYLLQREGEILYRRRVFEESFLGRVLEGRTHIHPQLWTSPDNDKQIAVAVRFLLTRLFFTISIGGKDSNSWLEGMIVDAQEIIKGEIWCIDVLKPSKSLELENLVESFYVLESTCEVVGSAPLPSKANASVSFQMRADWSAYIKQRTSEVLPLSTIPDPSRSSSSVPATSLLDQLSWTNHEEFTRGISKLWLKTVKVQREVGEAKRIVAERYILASVVGNSVSGQYMTSTEMASEFAGVPAGVGSVKSSHAKINLFLPACHHVESVHFTTAQDRRQLHPALAVVHTPSRGYFVLRDTGMQVGIEEEGVSAVWMEIIGCKSNGERA